MDNKVIEVIDHIGEKLGIAIDWTAENVWPQVMDVLDRYRIFQMVSNFLWIMLPLIVVIILIKLWTKNLKAYKTCLNDRSDNVWWDYNSYYNTVRMSDSTFALIMCSVFIGIGSVIAIFVLTHSIFKWLLIPEVKFIELFSSYLA